MSRSGEDPHEYVELWSFQSSERVKIIISRMIIPEKEREDFLNEEYLKKMESKAQYEEGKRKRIEIKKNAQKYKVNALLTGGVPWRTKGFTITREQIPRLIEALQGIFIIVESIPKLSTISNTGEEKLPISKKRIIQRGL